jgi:hypothetical protein
MFFTEFLPEVFVSAAEEGELSQERAASALPENSRSL